MRLFMSTLPTVMQKHRQDSEKKTGWLCTGWYQYYFGTMVKSQKFMSWHPNKSDLNCQSVHRRYGRIILNKQFDV